MAKFQEVEKEVPLLKLDLGCGKGANTPDGYEKIDKIAFPGVKVVDLSLRWPWKANTVDEVRAVYLLHVLTMEQRLHFVKELWRVLKPGAKAILHAPHWSAARAYGDPDVQWPPVSEAWFPCLSRAWREAQNSLIEGFTCNFDHTLGYGLHPELLTRNHEYQMHAVTFWKEAAQDLIVTLTKLE